MKKPQIIIKANPAQMNDAEREIAALELRKAGWSYPMIAGALNMLSTEVEKMVKHTLRKVARRMMKSGQEILTIEHLRYEEAVAALMPIVTDPSSRVEVRIKAVDALTKVLDGHRKLLGLDAPVKTETSVNIGLKQYSDAELRLKAEQLGLVYQNVIPIQLNQPLPGEEAEDAITGTSDAEEISTPSGQEPLPDQIPDLQP